MAMTPFKGGPKEVSKNSRRYPRTDMRIKAQILVRGKNGKKDRGLEATLETHDVSMTGVFFESTFFLRVGTQVQVSFHVVGDKRVIIAEGEIVREERAHVGGKQRSGFAVQFTGFVEDSAIVLASLFLAPRVKKFVDQYTKSRRAEELRSETDRLIDVVVGWELAKTQYDDLWAEL